MHRMRSLLALAAVAAIVAAPVPVRAASTSSRTIVAIGGAGYPAGSPCNRPDIVTGGAYASDDEAIQDAIDASGSGDTVHICAGTYDLENELSIGNGANITLLGDGIGATILDGGDAVRAINASPSGEYDAGGTLTIRDLSIRDTWVDNLELGGAVLADSVILERVAISDNGNAYNGGAVYAEGSVSVRDSIFDGNYARLDGGAIYSWNTGRSVSISRSTFDGNIADNIGGAVTSAGPLSIEASSFTANDAGNSGGAVRSERDLTIRRSSFVGNVAESDAAGAVFAEGNGGVATISNSHFADNSADTVAGAVLLHYFSAISIANSNFDSNDAVYAFGGALQLYNNGSISIVNSRFADNEARGGDYGGNGNGGAIDVCVAGNFLIQRSSFIRNHSTGYGGAIGLFGKTCGYVGPVTIRSSQFVDNTADDDGGAVWVGEGLREVSGSTFDSNVSYGGRGGAIFVGDAYGYPGGIGTMARNTFRYNSASGNGGALWVEGEVRAVSGNLFFQNASSSNGGAVYLSGYGAASSRAFRLNRFVDNSASVHGAAIYLLGGSVTGADVWKLAKANRYTGDPYACVGVGEIYPASGCF